MAQMTLEITIVEAPSVPVLSRRFSASPSELARKLAEILPRCFAEAAAEGLGPGRPFMRYHGHRATGCELEAGVMLDRAPKEGAKSTLPGGKLLAAVHVGPYEALGETHDALEAWAKSHAHPFDATPWEVYHTDPAEQTDPSKWQTRVYLPLR